jgi:hypothetical protein
MADHKWELCRCRVMPSRFFSCQTQPPLRRQTPSYNMLSGNDGAAFKATMGCAPNQTPLEQLHALAEFSKFFKKDLHVFTSTAA